MSETGTEASWKTATGIMSPPRHPRVPQLIQLEVARLGRLQELAAIDAECEASAAPIADEIERLEGEEAKLTAGAQLSVARRAELERLAQQHGQLRARILDERAAQDARLRSEAERIAAEAAELDAAQAHRESCRLTLDAALTEARERFDGARTTTRGRRLERKIREIEKQQETTVTRNPGARFYRVEMAIAAEAERMGLQEKVKAASSAMQNEKFAQRLSDGIRVIRSETKREPSEFEVKVIALGIINGMGVPTDDVDLRVVYRATHTHIETHLSDDARAKCIASLMKKQGRQSIDVEGAAEATAA